MSASDERIRLLKEELQRARAERDRQRALHKAEIDAEKESRDKAARERHEGTMSQLRAMRELLFEQRESQAQEKGRMEERHAEEVRLHETTLKQMSDVRTAVGSLRDESRADWEQRAEEQARIKAGVFLFLKISSFPSDTCASIPKTLKQLSRSCRKVWLRHGNNCYR
jgi:hypothetical protein